MAAPWSAEREEHPSRGIRWNLEESSQGQFSVVSKARAGGLADKRG